MVSAADQRLTREECRAYFDAGLPLPDHIAPIGGPLTSAQPLNGESPCVPDVREPNTAVRPKRKPRRRRWDAYNAFVDCSMRKLTRAEIVVWSILFRDTKDEQGEVHTAQSDIATRGGLSRRAVVEAIKGLRSKGMLEVVRQGGMRRGMSTYRVRPLDRLV